MQQKKLLFCQLMFFGCYKRKYKEHISLNQICSKGKFSLQYVKFKLQDLKKGITFPLGANICFLRLFPTKLRNCHKHFRLEGETTARQVTFNE